MPPTPSMTWTCNNYTRHKKDWTESTREGWKSPRKGLVLSNTSNSHTLRNEPFFGVDQPISRLLITKLTFNLQWFHLLQVDSMMWLLIQVWTFIWGTLMSVSVCLRVCCEMAISPSLDMCAKFTLLLFFVSFLLTLWNGAFVDLWLFALCMWIFVSSFATLFLSLNNGDFHWARWITGPFLCSPSPGPYRVRRQLGWADIRRWDDAQWPV